MKNHMSYAFKIALLLWVAIGLLFGQSVALPEFAGLLLLVASYVVRTRYRDAMMMLLAEGLLIIFMAEMNPLYLSLLGVAAHDLAERRLAPLILLLLPVGSYYLVAEWLLGYGLLILICSYAGYLRRQMEEAGSTYRQAYDQERKNRYMLEETKNKLLQAADETAHLAEIRERNRIAREIHDSIGHDLAGNLMQLQAAEKIMDKDPAKTRELIQKTVKGLAGSVELLRSTVHNIRPRQSLGWAYFEKIIENFHYCPVEFRHKGDASLLTPRQVEIIASTLKEALTNTARHSDATGVEVEIEIRERMIRLFVKDNGSGCRQLREGMGISGMRERIQNAGGSFVVTPHTGFMIVCTLPREEERR